VKFNGVTGLWVNDDIFHLEVDTCVLKDLNQVIMVAQRMKVTIHRVYKLTLRVLQCFAERRHVQTLNNENDKAIVVSLFDDETEFDSSSQKWYLWLVWFTE